MSYASVISGESSLVSWWRMGEASGNLADSKGALTATPSAGITYGVAGAIAGDSNTAISWVRASSHYAYMGDTGFPYGSAARTTEAWVKTTTAQIQGAFHYGNAGTGQWWSMGVAANGQARLSIFGYDGVFGAAGALSDGAWHHLVATYDGTQIRVYIDGSEASGSPTTQTVNTVAANQFIATDGTGFFDGSLDEVAIYNAALTGSAILAHYQAATVQSPTWTTPADTDSMSTTPDLKFTSPASAVAQHFYMELDTANTFNTGNLRTYRSDQDQTNWTYWNGGSWVALPSTGLDPAYAGNEIKYAVTNPLSPTTWYRRVRAGIVS